MRVRPRGLLALAAAAALALSAGGGCATLQQIASLRLVRFDLDGVSSPRLAGVDLSRLRGWDDLSGAEAARILAGVAGGSLPLRLTLRVAAENPADNPTPARLVALDWRLLLDQRETLTGSLDREIVLDPGSPVEIPLPVEVDLLRFFDESARDLFDLALAAAGGDTATHRLELRARPTVTTPYGPLRYPGEITISSTGA